MKDLFLAVYETSPYSFHYKVYVQGTTDDRTLYWNGHNYRFVTVTGQPYRGFETEMQAEEFMKKIEAGTERHERELNRAGEMKGASRKW